MKKHTLYSSQRKITNLFISSIIILISSLFSDTLSKTLSGTLFSDTYHIKDTLVIKSDESLRIEAGTVLLFQQKMCLQVNGTLFLEGTEDSPIILSSEISMWEGIQVNPNGKIFLKNVKIEKAVIGLSVSDSINIETFQNVIFQSNWEHFNLGHKGINVSEGQPISFGTSNQRNNSIVHENTIYKPTVLSRKNNEEELNLNSTLQNNLKPRRLPWLIISRYVLASASIGSSIAWGYYNQESKKYSKKYITKTDNSAKHYRLKAEKYHRISNIGKVFTFVTVPITFFSITIKSNTFKKENK